MSFTGVRKAVAASMEFLEVAGLSNLLPASEMQRFAVTVQEVPNCLKVHCT